MEAISTIPVVSYNKSTDKMYWFAEVAFILNNTLSRKTIIEYSEADAIDSLEKFKAGLEDFDDNP